MKRFAMSFPCVKSWISALLICSLLLIAIELLFAITKKLGVNMDDFLALMTRLEEERSREEDLVSRDRAFMENIEGKKRVIDRVLAERLSLQEAAAQFHALNLLCPEYDWERFRKIFPGRDDEERHCRQVLYSVRLEVRSRPSAYELLARLESQLLENSARS
jgi:hypothetical protein